MLQQRWTNTYGPDATSEYAGRSYWLCTENWPNQNYPLDLSVYYESGGYSNGYVPLFIVVGFQNKVYWDGNSSSFESALQQAINEMPDEGVFVQYPVDDQSLLFDNVTQYDLSDVFRNLDGGTVDISVESNSDPSIATISIESNIMTVAANNSVQGITEITLKGSSGTFSDTDQFVVKVYDPENYTVEDFETADFTKLDWGFTGAAGWIIDDEIFFDGSFSAKSAAITHGQKAEMIITAEYPMAGKIMFKYKVSSESNYDFLKFYIGRSEYRKISGPSGWLSSEFEVESGTFDFKWSYEKDGSTSSYSDCAWVDQIVLEGGKVTGIEYITSPSGIELYQNYPNPFNPETKISFAIPENGEVTLSVFTYKGELVENIFDGTLNKGMHSYNFNACDLTSGVYFYKLETLGNSAMKKMVIIK